MNIYTAMVQLINKGGFRERANRSRRYKDSENQQTTLDHYQYQPNDQDSKNSVHLKDENLLQNNQRDNHSNK